MGSSGRPTMSAGASLHAAWDRAAELNATLDRRDELAAASDPLGRTPWWGPPEDGRLLLGIVRYGYGCWLDIAFDRRLALLPSIYRTVPLTLPPRPAEGDAEFGWLYAVRGADADIVLFLRGRMSLLQGALLAERRAITLPPSQQAKGAQQRAARPAHAAGGDTPAQLQQMKNQLHSMITELRGRLLASANDPRLAEALRLRLQAASAKWHEINQSLERLSAK